MSSKVQKYGVRNRLKELSAVLLFYFFFSALYHLVLWYNGGGSEKGIFSWIDLETYWYFAGMQYVMYLIGSILIWFLGVYLLRKFPVLVRIIAVFILISIAVFVLRDLRYSIIESIGIWHLEGYGAVWHIYIPWLFMCIQFGVYFAYQYFRENQMQLRLEGELRQAALNSEISAIKAQLNPHFLYNVFNTINASLPPENEKTRDLIAQLSDLFRYQLQVSKEDLVSIENEIMFTQKYLELEKARFEDRLNFDIIVDDALLSSKIPPMLIQPIVENSIKHGLSSKVEGGSIDITIRKEGTKMYFSVADTGVGVVDKRHLLDSGVGLKNTAFRLKNIFGAELEFRDNQPSGLIVEFSI